MSKFNLGGAPLKYEKPADLQKVLEKYFNDTNPDEWTVTGLALAMGSKQLLNDYEARKGYTEMVKRAKLMVENSYEISMRKHGKPGDIFGLKNFGWSDRMNINQHNSGEVSIVQLPDNKRGRG